MINNLPTRKVVIVNMASASGEFIKPLSGNGRIVITATRSGQEQNATRFAEYFIAALGNLGGRYRQEQPRLRARSVHLREQADQRLLRTERASWPPNTHCSMTTATAWVTRRPKRATGRSPRPPTSIPCRYSRPAATQELAKLFTERLRLEGEIEQLKLRKAQMNEDEYENALEKLLIEFAKIGQGIRAKQKK